MLTVTQRLMSGLGQAGSDWAWSMSIHDINISPPQVTDSMANASEELVSEPETKAQDTHDHSSSTSDPEDL